MGMCSHFFNRIVIIFAVLALLCGCGVMDSFLPSSGTYKVNARVNSLPLDEFSFVSSGNKILPFFENKVSGDPDVTALTLFLRDSRGEIAGWKVVYLLDTEGYDQINNQTNNQDEQTDSDDNENNIVSEQKSGNSTAPNRNGEELIIPVSTLDYNLPYFPIPSNLPMGRYTLVSQVMKGNQILQRSEKSFFYLANVDFSFNSIQVHQGGISDSSQLISKGAFIMLEAKLDFDRRLDPYIVWYNGKRIISEGSFSQGAGNLLWKVPEENGFTSIRAEAFPIKDRQDLAGYSKDISLLVSEKKSDMHLLSEDDHDVLYWYVFEGDLHEAKSHGLPERALKHTGNILPHWMPSSGTFGLAAGTNDTYTLPGVSFSNSENKFWQILCRLKPLDDGGIFSVQFGTPAAVTMNLIKDNSDLVLMLVSSTETVTRTLSLPEWDSFLTVEVNFLIQPDHLTVKLNIHGDFTAEPVAIKEELKNDFFVTLGSQLKNDVTDSFPNRSVQPVFTAILDEFALLHLPYTESKFMGEITEEPPVKDESPEEVSLGENEHQKSDASVFLT